MGLVQSMVNQVYVLRNVATGSLGGWDLGGEHISSVSALLFTEQQPIV